MAKLTIWQGGVKIQTVGEIPQPNSDAPAESNLQTCKHRAEKEESRTIRTCCSSRTATGYACIKLGLFPLSESQCESCQHYVKKL